MQLTDEMRAALARAMLDYLQDYFDRNASEPLKAKVAAEKKTIKGAYAFIESVAKAFAKGNVCAMPDALAYNLLMHYMEDEPEGTLYEDPATIAAKLKAQREAAEKAKKEAEEAEKKHLAELKKKAADLSKGALFKTTAADLKAQEPTEEQKKRKAEEDADLFAAEHDAIKRLEEAKAKAEAVKKVTEQLMFDL